jgi:hypothetical protein
MRKIAVYAGILAISAAPACAQSDTVKMLEELSRQRNESLRLPPQTPAPQAPMPSLRPTSLTCKSTDPWQPVRAEPNASAPVIGKTQPQVAVTGQVENGFARIIFYNGKPGYIPAGAIRPFRSQFNPNAKCTVAGQRPSDGAPMFRIS